MLISNFYNLLDEELQAIVSEYANEKKMLHKNINQNKGFALLIWFLDFYAQKKPLYRQYITDGNDDNSCDIIFFNPNVKGEDIYYVVQSKWVKFEKDTRVDAYPKINKQEFGYTLSDFQNILSGDKKKGTNEAFNTKYDDLRTHLEKNGKVKFLFFTLADYNDEITESLEKFNARNSPNISMEIIDIQRIRRDYIEFRFKEIQTNNPLEYQYDPEDETIEIEIERSEGEKRDIFEFAGREKAYIFTLKPKTIFDLFNKYKFSLFFKNVRNPLHHSNYNEKIVETLLRKPSSFWYFNNGITAITKVMPNIGIHAKRVEVDGLQIINGAQTVYSIYQAYLNATLTQRKVMDNDAKVVFRLINSSDEDFNLQITRYTNMQNPMQDRDFWANDAIQIRLQNESFKTNTWYEKRRDEFRDLDKLKEVSTKYMPNEVFGIAYLAFHLQKPVDCLQKTGKIFTSRKDDKDGLYEEVFNESTHFDDMYASFVAFSILLGLVSSDFEDLDNSENLENFNADLHIPALSISKIVIQKYFDTIFETQRGKHTNINHLLIEVWKKIDDLKAQEILKIIIYSIQLIENKLGRNIDTYEQKLDKLITNPVFYETLKEEIEDNPLDIKAIQAIDIEDFIKNR